VYGEGTLSPPGERAFPLVEKISAARATRYDDIPFCMGEQSKPCDFFELDESLTRENFQNSHGNFMAD
jgi:hypothetical protein